MRRWHKVLRLIFSVICVSYIWRIFQLHFFLPTRRSFVREEHRQSFDVTTSQLIRSHNETRHQQILRALIIFYPNDQEQRYLPELRWFYWSWIAMMKSGESKTWRTDLIIFTGNFTTNLQKLGCKFNQRRLNQFERPECRVFHYVRLAARTTTKRNTTQSTWSSIINEKFKNYEYIDSLNVIVEGYPIFMMYDFILKTDIDVFLTQYFAVDLPITRKTLLTGRGGYSVTFNINRLRRIAHDIGWHHANLSNIGSTWYGPPDIACRVGNFSLQAMVHLYENEFTHAERQGKFGIKQWPDWHYGVLSMYGAHLAVNHLVLKEQIDVRIANKILDQSIQSKSLNEIDTYRILHLHCWHVHVPFSKFDFKKNQYDHIDPKTLLNDTSPRAFAMRIALESKKFSLEQLAEQLAMIKKS